MGLNAGSKWLHCYCEEEVDVLDEDDRLTNEEQGGRGCIKCLKRGWIKIKDEEVKKFKKGGMLVKVVGAVKSGAVTPLQTMSVYIQFQS